MTTRQPNQQPASACPVSNTGTISVCQLGGRRARFGSRFATSRRLAAVVVIAALLSPVRQSSGAQDKPPSLPRGPTKEVSVTDRGTVRLHVAGEPLANILHLLSLEGQRNIVTSPSVKGTVTANLYDVTFEEALQAILTPIDAGFRVFGKFVYVYSNRELADLEAARTAAIGSRVYRLNYILPGDAVTLITPALEKGESVTPAPAAATGLQSADEDGGGKTLAGPDFILLKAGQRTHEIVQALLREIDVRPQQALIEATILRAQLTDDNAMGVDFTLVGGVDLELLGASSNGIADLSLGQLPPERFELFNAASRTDFTGAVPQGGITLGIIKDHVGVFVRALEEITDTTVLANPKVLALNRQKGQVIVGRRDGYLTTTVTETQAVQSVQFLETGTRLIFRPFIGDDGYIRVELHPEDSVGFVNAQGLPSEQTTEVTTNVIVRDGETILIGGLFREVTTDARSRIPGLGTLPGLEWLLGSRNESTGREEVIILMTIHIVKDHDQYAKGSKEVWEDVERIRVGQRAGLMWFGRDRLTQRYYQGGLEALGRGDRDKALWQANLALHVSPRFLPAMQLREKILRQRDWHEDGASSRIFLHELIAKERGYTLPPFARPIIPNEQPVPAPPPENVNRESKDDDS